MATYTSPEDADTELHRLLLRAVPENKHGNKTISHLATMLECTRATIFNWINDEKLPALRAKQIVDLSEGHVTLDDFHKFVYAA